MITRIKIDGFKAFKDFEIELQPLTLIAGANGAGKSNLFDALKLLGRLMEVDIKTAFQEQRGDARELFTLVRNQVYEENMLIEVDLLLNKTIEDSWGRSANLDTTRFCYRLVLERKKDEKGVERIWVKEEQLKAIRPTQDTWVKTYISDADRAVWCPQFLADPQRQRYIQTKENGMLTFGLKDKDDDFKRVIVSVKSIKQPILGRFNDATEPHLLAVRQAIKAWQFLHLSPSVLRTPSPRLGSNTIRENGANLAATLFRIKEEYPRNLRHIARNLNNLLPEFTEILVEEDVSHDVYVLKAKSADGQTFSARLLSEGTLRMLVLCTLKYDELHEGVLCFEEPENGLHPFRLHQVLTLLGDLSTDFSNTQDQLQPLKQLIANTHSPVLVAEAVKSNRSMQLLYAKRIARILPEQKREVQVTSMTPVLLQQLQQHDKAENIVKEPATIITHREVINYLKTAKVE